MTIEPSTDARAHRRPLGLFALCAAIILVGDVVTKAIVLAELPLGGRGLLILGEFLRFRHIQNSGGLFGFFPGNASYFAIVSVIAAVAILWVLIRSDRRSTMQQISLGMVFGGALGNLYDRVRLGAVVDFIDVGIGPDRFPTFNVADMGVSVGVSLLILWLFITDRRGDHESAGESDAGTATESEPERISEAGASDRTD